MRVSYVVLASFFFLFSFGMVSRIILVVFTCEMVRIEGRDSSILHSYPPMDGSNHPSTKSFSEVLINTAINGCLGRPTRDLTERHPPYLNGGQILKTC